VFPNGHYDHGIRNIYVIFGFLKLKGKFYPDKHIVYMYMLFLGF